MANTPTVAFRVPPELADKARARIGQPDVDMSTLIRAGLAMLAGSPLAEALAIGRGQRGPKPRERAST